MRKGFATLAALTVMSVLALAGPARGNDGDPLILGQANSAQSPTSLNGFFSLNSGSFQNVAIGAGSDVRSSEVTFTCAGTLIVREHRRSGTARGYPTQCVGTHVVANVNVHDFGDNEPNVWVQQVKVTDDGHITVKLNTYDHRRDVEVAYFGFRGP